MIIGLLNLNNILVVYDSYILELLIFLFIIHYPIKTNTYLRIMDYNTSILRLAPNDYNLNYNCLCFYNKLISHSKTVQYLSVFKKKIYADYY